MPELRPLRQAPQPAPRVAWTAFTAAAAAYAIGGTLYYILFTYRAFLSSDAAVANVLAGEIVRTGRLLPGDFWYVNQDLWIFFKQLLVLPWAAAGRNGYAAHASAVLVVTVVLLAACHAVLRRLGFGKVAALWGPILLCLGYSDHYVDMLFGEAAYTWTLLALLLFMLVLVPAVRLEAGGAQAVAERGQRWRVTAFAALVLVFSIGNPVRFGTFIGIPLLVGGVVSLLPQWRSGGLRQLARWVPYVASGGVAFAIAWLAHRHLLQEVSNISGASAAELVPLERLPQTLAWGIAGWLRVLGVDWTGGTPLGTRAGLRMVLHLFAAGCLLLLPSIALARLHRQLDAGVRLLAYTGATGLAFVGFLVAATGLQGGNAISAIYTSRYVVSYLALMLLAGVVLWPRVGGGARLAFGAAVAVVALSSLRAWNPVQREQDVLPNASVAGFELEPGWRANVAKTRRIIAALQAQGLHQGYAPYWHSHPYTVLSGGRVEVRPVHLNGGDLRPWLHLSSSHWYTPGYADRGAFLMVPLDEVAKVQPGLVDSCAPQPERVLTIENYRVFVYAANPLTTVTTRNLGGVGQVCLGPRSLRQVGHWDAGTHSVRATPADGAGFLHFGPYQSLMRGRYEVRFKLHAGTPSGTGTEPAYVDVVAGGRNVLARAPVPAGAIELSVPVTVGERVLQNVEFRVYTYGQAAMALEAIDVKRLPDPGA